jgi:hypothetical protein
VFGVCLGGRDAGHFVVRLCHSWRINSRRLLANMPVEVWP